MLISKEPKTFFIMNKFFLNVINEEPLSKVSLDEIKGGLGCVCNSGSSFNCTCFGNDDANSCTCNNSASYSCSTFKIKDPDKEDLN